MANYGLGIGAFMGGLMQGAQFAREMKRQEKEDARRDQEFDLRLQDRDRSIKRDDQRFGWETEDRTTRSVDRERAIKRDDQRLGWETEDRNARKEDRERSIKRDDQRFGWEAGEQEARAAERTANKPLIDAKREAELADVNTKKLVTDATRQGGAEATAAYEKSKSEHIVQKRDENGKALPEYTVDGKTVGSLDEATRLHDQKHGSFMDHIYKVAIPRRQQAYAQAGDVQSAAALGKWVEDENVRKGIDSVARLESAFQTGDWDGVNKHFNAIHANNDYMDTSNYDIVTEPIKKNGKTVGLKATIKDKANGTETIKSYDNLEELHAGLMAVVNPFDVFESNKAEMQRASAARVEMAKGNAKLANDIELERQKAIFDIAKANAGVGGKQPVEVLQSRLAAQIKVMADNNATIGEVAFNRLPPDQQAAAAMAAINAQDQQIGGKLGQPGTRPAPLLYSRQQ